MRAVVQRVMRASVWVDERQVSGIGPGVVVLVAVGVDDSERDAEWLADKVVDLRIFSDQDGRLNLSLPDVEGELLAVSQFTLYGDCRRGKRPGFSGAAGPEQGQRLFCSFVARVRARNVPVKEGVFRAAMQVELVNDGPVTLLLDSSKTF